MNRFDPPTFEQLVEWLDGRLPPDEAAAVAAALEQPDAATQANLDWLRRFHGARHQVRLALPPQRVRTELTRRFEAFAQERRQPGFFQRLMALLSFDSGAGLAVAGVRSAATQGQQRQLVFVADAAEIVLNVLPRAQDRQVNLTGQVFPALAAPARFSVHLLRDSAEVALTSTDDLGEFGFEGLPAGEYDLVVSSDQFEVVMSPVPLRLT